MTATTNRYPLSASPSPCTPAFLGCLRLHPITLASWVGKKLNRSQDAVSQLLHCCCCCCSCCSCCTSTSVEGAASAGCLPLTLPVLACLSAPALESLPSPAIWLCSALRHDGTIFSCTSHLVVFTSWSWSESTSSSSALLSLAVQRKWNLTRSRVVPHTSKQSTDPTAHNKGGPW